MENSSLFERLRSNWLPITLGVAGLFFLGYGLFSLTASKKDKPDILFEAASDQAHTAAVSKAPEKRLAVDVEGAVEKPGVYDLPSDARVQDALIAAGGMSRDADRAQIAKSLNLAAKVIDGGKIYIPRAGDPVLASGSSADGSGVLGAETSSTININTASAKDLDSLPGIGEVTAQKIISNRPYGSVDELLSKKVVSSKVFSEIKEKVSVY